MLQKLHKTWNDTATFSVELRTELADFMRSSGSSFFILVSDLLIRCSASTSVHINPRVLPHIPRDVLGTLGSIPRKRPAGHSADDVQHLKVLPISPYLASGAVVTLA